MIDIILCLALIPILFYFYSLFGKLAAKLLRLKLSGGLCILFGVFVYYALFQAAALPLIMLKKKLSWLSLIWLIVLALALVVSFRFEECPEKKEKKGFPKLSAVKIVMLVIMALQFYYIVTSEYMGWDTTFYTGTIATSVDHNSMYLYLGESGRKVKEINLRYALSGFYMHSAVWCQVLKIRAIYMAKIVQGGVAGILSGMVVYQLGVFLFSGRFYEKYLPRERVSDAAAGMVIVFAVLNVFFDSIYSTSDFLLSRGMEAKAYCANFVLPCILLFCLMLWRESSSGKNGGRETRACLFAAMLGSVPISMSSLMLAPALLTILFVPLILRKNGRKMVRVWMPCVLPNVFYLAVYGLYVLGKFRIGV